MQAPYYSNILNEVGWTLNYEMAFYAIFCACLMFGRYALSAVVVAICGLVFVSPLLFGQPLSIDPNDGIPFDNMCIRVVTNP